MHTEPSRSSRAANDCETARKLSSTNALGILHVSKSSTSASVVPGAGVSRGAKLTLSVTTLWLTDILTSHGQLPRFSTRALAQTSNHTPLHPERHFRAIRTGPVLCQYLSHPAGSPRIMKLFFEIHPKACDRQSNS